MVGSTLDGCEADGVIDRPSPVRDPPTAAPPSGAEVKTNLTNFKSKRRFYSMSPIRDESGEVAEERKFAAFSTRGPTGF